MHNQFGDHVEEIETVKQKKKRKQKYFLLITLGVLFVIIVTILIIVLSKTMGSNQIFLPKVTISQQEWTNQSVVLTVTHPTERLISYSFDGGNTWQMENSYVVKENASIVVLVKNEKEKLSKATTVHITNIDLEGPSVNFTDPLYIQKGDAFNPKTGLVVSDLESGVLEVIVEPATIDTSIDQQYILLYTVKDNVGNVTVKERNVIVRNLILKTYYRSRSIKTERYQCDTGTCKREVYGEWGEWTLERLEPSEKLQVETKIE
ncbi:MAG: hypothetical protein PUB18_02140 [bacterium]|nr:hypothetical protein [bacterium]